MTSTNVEKISKFEVKLETSFPKNRCLKSNKKKKKRKQELDQTKVENNLQQIVYETLLKNNMAPTGIPTFTLDNTNSKCNLTYQTKINLLTPINNIDHLKVTKHNTDATQQMIDNQIDEIKRDSTKYSILKEDRGVTESDLVYLEIEIANDLKLNQSVILNKPFEIPNLPKTIVGMKLNETKIVDVQLPDTLQYRKYAGKTENIKITVKQILTYEFPTMNDTFCKTLGFDDVVHHLVNIISEVISKQKQSFYLKVEEEICSQLLKKYPIEVSEQAIQEHKTQLANKLNSKLTKYKWSKKEIDDYLIKELENLLNQTKKELTQDSITSQLIAYFKQNYNIGEGYNFANLTTIDPNLKNIIKYKIIDHIIKTSDT